MTCWAITEKHKRDVIAIIKSVCIPDRLTYHYKYATGEALKDGQFFRKVYLYGICQKEKIHFSSCLKKVISWKNARSCTYQRGNQMVTVHWNDKMHWLPAIGLRPRILAHHKNRAHTRACNHVILNSAASTHCGESIREGNLHTCVLCCRRQETCSVPTSSSKWS